MNSVPVVLSRPALAVVEEGRQKKWTTSGAVRVDGDRVDGWPAFRIHVAAPVAAAWREAARQRNCSISQVLIDAYVGRFRGERKGTGDDAADGWKDSTGGDLQPG